MLAIVPLLLLAAATWRDLKTREIPDWISLALAGWAILATGAGWHKVGWLSLCGGLLLGFVLTAPLFWLGGLGGGDVKLVTALGACLGPQGLLETLFWVAIAGGVLALFAKWRKQADFAYVPAIFAGLVMHSIQVGVLNHAR